MPLAAGTRFGPYEIVAPLGAGGMGEVYRAQDTKLGRSVAVKVLPDVFAFDPERIARFEREAKVLASLNHPHIATLHGMEEAGGRLLLVMELVEGETLAERIAESRGGLESGEALRIARQIAEALEAAHEHGIIHRDLKPANIKLRPDGAVKILDFGLAKAIEPAGPDRRDVTMSPTITTPAMTQLGVILGTAAYMSPEQAKGRAADKRSDVWAFGCVLYEMLAGRRAFEGDDVSDMLATVLKSEPDWSALPASLPDGIRTLIQGCLRKDPRERIADISTARFLLSQPQSISSTARAAPARPAPLWKRATPVVAGVLIGAAVLAVIRRTPAPPSATVSRFAIILPQEQPLTLPRQAVAISPDGSRIAYAAGGRLYLRSISEIEPTPIAGADPAIYPVFSPDSRSLLFWANSALKRIDVGGGRAETICQTTRAPYGISWGPQGILFAQVGSGIMRVPASGGTPEVLVALSDTGGMATSPQWLPDGRTLLFTLARAAASRGGADTADNSQVFVQSLATGERTAIIDKGTDARYVPTGHIVYVNGGTLFAVPFDAATRTVTGPSVRIIEGVRRVPVAGVGVAHFAFGNGTLVYVPGPVSGARQNLLISDRAGGSDALKLPPGSYAFPRVSRDGKWLAFESTDGKETNVAVFEIAGTSSLRRLTFGGNNRYPIWSADGRRIVFQSDREGDLAVFWQPVDGGTAERLTKPDPDTAHVPESWSPTEDLFLFSATKGTTTSLWTYSLRDRKAALFGDVASSSLPSDAAFSPDGRWVAYQVGTADEAEGTTFVQPFPPNGTKYQIARGGRAAWSRDGTSLFFVPGPSQFASVTMRTRPSVAFGNPIPVPRGFGVADPGSPRPYDLMPDGRVVGVGMEGQTATGSIGPSAIHVVLNWYEELKARVPTR